MSAFIFALGLTLMHFLWQGLLLGCATAVALTLLRNSRAEYRYLIACVGLLACLCWPALELWQRLAGDAGRQRQLPGRRSADESWTTKRGSTCATRCATWSACGRCAPPCWRCAWWRACCG
jgi:D-alanyl-D-alanine endopeptidase (penicillin-binding protein 7)